MFVTGMQRRAARGHQFARVFTIPAPTAGCLLITTVVAVAGGFYASLLTLIGLAEANTPVAFVVFVPALAMYVGYERIHSRGVPATRDYFFDALFFAVFAVMTVVALFILPVRMSWDYWLVRPDLLALPVFAAAVVTLLLGTGATWRLWPALVCLWLAWPVPYFAVIGVGNDVFLHFTTTVVNMYLHVLPVAMPPAAVGGTIYTVATPGGTASLVIGSSCAGLNGFLGYLVIGGPTAWGFTGSRRAKMLWVACGMLLTLVANAVRVLLILTVARLAGTRVALDVVHPVLGAILFGIVFLTMLNAQPLFRLQAARRRAGVLLPGTNIAPPKAFVSILLVFVLLVTVGNRALTTYGWLGSSDNELVTLPQPGIPGHIGQWHLATGQPLDWFIQYFGQKSHAYAYDYLPLVGDDDVQVQLIVAPDTAGFHTYSVENCFLFHGSTLLGVTHTDLGGGTGGSLLSFRDADGAEGSALYWTVPVSDRGEHAHQRTLLIAYVNSIDTPTPPMTITTPFGRLLGLRLSEFLSPYIGQEQPVSHAVLVARLQAMGSSVVREMATGNVRKPG